MTNDEKQRAILDVASRFLHDAMQTPHPELAREMDKQFMRAVNDVLSGTVVPVAPLEPLETGPTDFVSPPPTKLAKSAVPVTPVVPVVPAEAPSEEGWIEKRKKPTTVEGDDSQTCILAFLCKRPKPTAEEIAAPAEATTAVETTVSKPISQSISPESVQVDVISVTPPPVTGDCVGANANDEEEEEEDDSDYEASGDGEDDDDCEDLSLEADDADALDTDGQNNYADEVVSVAKDDDDDGADDDDEEDEEDDEELGHVCEDEEFMAHTGGALAQSSAFSFMVEALVCDAFLDGTIANEIPETDFSVLPVGMFEGTVRACASYLRTQPLSRAEERAATQDFWRDEAIQSWYAARGRDIDELLEAPRVCQLVDEISEAWQLSVQTNAELRSAQRANIVCWGINFTGPRKSVPVVLRVLTVPMHEVVNYVAAYYVFCFNKAVKLHAVRRLRVLVSEQCSGKNTDARLRGITVATASDMLLADEHEAFAVHAYAKDRYIKSIRVLRMLSAAVTPIAQQE